MNELILYDFLQMYIWPLNEFLFQIDSSERIRMNYVTYIFRSIMLRCPR